MSQQRLRPQSSRYQWGLLMENHRTSKQAPRDFLENIYKFQHPVSKVLKIFTRDRAWNLPREGNKAGEIDYAAAWRTRSGFGFPKSVTSHNRSRKYSALTSSPCSCSSENNRDPTDSIPAALPCLGSAENLSLVPGQCHFTDTEQRSRKCLLALTSKGTLTWLLLNSSTWLK